MWVAARTLVADYSPGPAIDAKSSQKRRDAVSRDYDGEHRALLLPSCFCVFVYNSTSLFLTITVFHESPTFEYLSLNA